MKLSDFLFIVIVAILFLLSSSCVEDFYETSQDQYCKTDNVFINEIKDRDGIFLMEVLLCEGDSFPCREDGYCEDSEVYPFVCIEGCCLPVGPNLEEEKWNLLQITEWTL